MKVNGNLTSVVSPMTSCSDVVARCRLRVSSAVYTWRQVTLVRVARLVCNFRVKESTKTLGQRSSHGVDGVKGNERLPDDISIDTHVENGLLM